MHRESQAFPSSRLFLRGRTVLSPNRLLALVLPALVIAVHASLNGDGRAALAVAVWRVNLQEPDQPHHRSDPTASCHLSPPKPKTAPRLSPRREKESDFNDVRRPVANCLVLLSGRKANPIPAPLALQPSSVKTR